MNKSPTEIALEKIRIEQRKKTGHLDLGNMGLEEIPEELFELMHLKWLVLERVYQYREWVFESIGAGNLNTRKVRVFIPTNLINYRKVSKIFQTLIQLHIRG